MTIAMILLEILNSSDSPEYGGDRHFYTVFAGIFLFSLDKLFRIIQSRPETCIIAARIFPCKAIELILPKDPRLVYTPKSTIFIKIPSISTLQWHSFSLSSSSNIDEHTMSVIIRCDGWWTRALYNLVQAGPGSHDNQTKCLPVAVEGPYGPASLDFLRYDSLLLIAGGIGITPLLSILHEIDSIRNSSIGRFPAQVQLIYVVKKSQDICLLDSVLPLLLNQASEQFHPKVKVLQYSNYAPQKIGNSLFVAAIVGFSSTMFIILLSCFNRAYLHTGKKKASIQKHPSSVIDIFLLCSFAVAIMSGALKHGKEIKPSSTERHQALEEIEIHFGGRPDFQEIFCQFPNETDESDVGVLVCGPETMKESVASMCRLRSECIRKKPRFCFQSLTFNL
ncbi:Ferric-chelate reductase (NADH) [Bertholletia excelsa]